MHSSVQATLSSLVFVSFLTSLYLSPVMRSGPVEKVGQWNRSLSHIFMFLQILLVPHCLSLLRSNPQRFPDGESRDPCYLLSHTQCMSWDTKPHQMLQWSSLAAKMNEHYFIFLCWPPLPTPCSKRCASPPHQQSQWISVGNSISGLIDLGFGVKDERRAVQWAVDMLALVHWWLLLAWRSWWFISHRDTQAGCFLLLYLI